MPASLTMRASLLTTSLILVSACSSKPPEVAPAPTPARGATVAQANATAPLPAPDPGHSVGDSTAYGGALHWTNDKHTEASFTIVSRSHVVLLEVTPGTGRIWPIFPDLTTPTVMRDIGTHTATLRRSGGMTASSAMIAPNGTRDIREDYTYERCMDAAAARAKPQPKQQAPTYDKDGKLINSGDPPKVSATTFDGATSVSSNCRTPSNKPAAGSPGTTYNSGGAAATYLVFLASEIPVTALDIVGMKFSEGDMNSLVFAMAKKLYGSAPWSGYYLRW